MNGRLEWNDLRVVLAVARAGSFAEAAKRLGLSTPTVFRHARALEQRLGTLVFRRDSTGVTLSPAGREVALVAERIEEEVGALEQKIGHTDTEASGTIRLATVDTLLAGPLMSVIAKFRESYPAICLDLRSSIEMADLGHREADAAVRAGGEPPEALVGRRLCKIAVAVYRSSTGPFPEEIPNDQQVWVVPGERLNHLASSQWLKSNGCLARAAIRADSLHTLMLAVANGLGLGVLPCYLADLNSRLVRVSGPIVELESDLWFLTHGELRNSARIRALSDFLAKSFAELKPLFRGELA